MNHDLLRQIDGDIADQGYAVYTVSAEDGPPISWTYTIGLDDQGRPELIVIGQNHDAAVAMIAAAVEQAPGLVAGVSLLGVHDTPVRTVGVHHDLAMAGAWFGLAHLRRGSTQPMRALQLVVPDEDGEWEWSERQPIIGEVWW